MARPVDAEALEKKISEWLGQPGNGDYYSGYDAALCAVQDLIADTPTITPPNEPLTLEQLREMDGEPVWVEEVKHWALIDIEKGGQWDGIPFAVWAENGTKFTYNVESRDLHCYRRPPEGEA